LPSEIVSVFPVGEWVMMRKVKIIRIAVKINDITAEGGFLGFTCP